jgi:hypothetical protein
MIIILLILAKDLLLLLLLPHIHCALKIVYYEINIPII